MQLNEKWNATWLRGHDWKDPWQNVEHGAEVLRDKRKTLERIVGNWAALAPEVQLRAFLAAYNTGESNVKASLIAGRDVDASTTGRDYSLDTLRRAVAYGFNETV